MRSLQDGSSRDGGQVLGTARLLTASATTGWTDWVHGQLWLLEDGLLRVATDLVRTLGHGPGPTVPDDHAVTAEMNRSEAERQAEQHRRNVWVPRERIAGAVLRGGWLSDSVRLELVDGRTVSFRWMRQDGAYIPLKRALEAWVGQALRVRGRPSPGHPSGPER